MPDVVIVCALEHEARSARRVARDAARVVVSGPGAARCAEAVRSTRGGAEAVILFGVAGGLAPGARSPAVSRVIDLEGGVWTPTLVGEGAGATVVGVDAPACTPAEKARLRSASGADLVDMESHGFARAAADAGLRWGVVRGIGDGADEALPREVMSSAGTRGATRAGRVAADLARDPRRLAGAVALARGSRRALRSASGQLERMLADL